VFIKSVRIKSFRNIEDAFIELSPKVNILFGENAQGKTNFLESLYSSVNGLSFRTADYKNILNNDQPAYVDISIQSGSLTHRLQTMTSLTERRLILNEKKVSRSTIRAEFSTILFSPESLSVIKNSDRERRDLVDDLIEDLFPEKRKVLQDFRKILRQRNVFLKDLKEKKREINTSTVQLLDTLTEQFLKISSEMVVMRLRALQKIQPEIQKVLADIFNEHVDICVDYVISDQIIKNEPDHQQLYDAMYKRWLQLKSAEIKSGSSLVGPHKHDIRVLFNEKDSRHYCSQGQQRLLILAFKMAQIGLHYDVHETYPILLLDDVLSEIDETKRVRLIEALEVLRAQIFITTTEDTVLRYLNRSTYTVFDVSKGRICPKLASQEEASVR
jgi:DNA replication and repair protein RecF